MIERYTDQAALDAHHRSEHFTTAIAALPGWVSGPPTFSRYTTEQDMTTDLLSYRVMRESLIRS